WVNETSGYFLGVRSSYMVTWSHQHLRDGSALTTAMVISRPDTVSDILRQIDSFKEFIGHPVALALACANQLLNKVDRDGGQELSTILDVELRTGYNPWAMDAQGRSPSLYSETSVLNPAVLSGTLSSTQVVLALYQRYLSFGNVVALLLSEEEGHLAFADDA